MCSPSQSICITPLNRSIVSSSDSRPVSLQITSNCIFLRLQYKLQYICRMFEIVIQMSSLTHLHDQAFFFIEVYQYITEHTLINTLHKLYPIIKMTKPTLSLSLVALSLLVLANTYNITLPNSFTVPVIATVQAGYSVTYSSILNNPDCWMFTLNHPFSAWTAYYVNDASQWVQVSSTKNEVWVAVITQGRPNFDQWVTEYRVSYTLDGTTWTYVDKSKLFTGNSDRNTQVRQFFSKGIYARAIRIHPTKWNNYVSTRFEALIIDS